MANDNKRFLDKIGVQHLWDKINEYFSQIGHRHETSDVNGLDEYMEENAKAIRDTEKVVEELSELPLYPSEEQLGKIYACNGRLYRGKKLPKLVLDFSQIEDDGEGNVTQEILRDFINQNGMNIVMEYCNNKQDLRSTTFEKYNNGIYIDGSIELHFRDRSNCEEFNYWNSVYIKSLKITAQSPYDASTQEVWLGDIDYHIEDYYGESIGGNQKLDIENFPPRIETFEYVFGTNEDINLCNLCAIHTEANEEPFTLLKLELELVICNNEDEYNSGIFHDFLVWEEVSEEELPIEDTTPATEDTRKRFYREIENNNIYVTDAEYSPGEGGFVIDIVHPKTGGQINDDDELRGYIDPSEVWTNGVNGVEQIYADNRYWLNDLGERVTITPIRIGTKNNSGSISLSTKTDVDLYFSPYISFNASTQEAIIEQDYTTIEVDDADAGDTEEYEVELFDNINLLEKKWTIVHVPASPEVYINTNRRCYLHKIVKKGEGEGDRYYWSQIAKIQDIEDKINALPEVARTGSYTDLFNKPCIGDVQTYDWPNDEDLPIIDKGTGNCDNRLKQLLRWNNSLYTAVVNDSGVSIDMRDFSNRYNTTKPEVAGPLTEYIFKTRMDLRSTAAYEDYYVSGSKYMIQNTKGIGLQLGSSSDYGELLIAMRDYDDSKRMLFNNIEVGLQSWSSDGEKTTDNANIYIEIGTSEYVSSGGGWELFKEGMLKAGMAYIRSTNGTPSDEFINVLDEGYTNVNYNGEVYNVMGYKFDDVVSTWRLSFDREISVVEGEYVTFVDHETPGTGVSQILTPQKTENIWFKRYSDEYTEEWVSTQYYCVLDEAIDGDYVCYNIYDPNTDDYAYDFIASLNVGDVIKISDIEMTVKEIDENWVYFDYRDDYPTEDLTVSIKQRVYVNNPVLKETVKLTGTNCDYIKIWTQYDENPEQYGRCCVIKSIVFNDIKYEFDEEPRYNRVFYRKDYWKQISGSGSGSIKVIDLT